MLYTTGILHKLFEIMIHMVGEHGGDGAAWIVSVDHLKLADIFALYQYEGKPWFTQRIDVDDTRTHFVRNQESISFAYSIRYVSEHADIVVKI